MDSGDTKPKVVVVMPAYNAARTLRLTYEAIPHNSVDSVILVDDGSSDETVAIARQLGLTIFVHARNFGYGANQKTCYIEALKEGADLVVMLHPDYQYDPTLIPDLIQPVLSGEADIVLGSRLLVDKALQHGMPKWKYAANRILTFLENTFFRLHLSEYHTGYRAYSRNFLEEIPFLMNSDKFLFDQEILAQAVAGGYRIKEVAVPTRYFREASSASFVDSVFYGFGILWLLARYGLHTLGLLTQKQFVLPSSRYRKV